MGKYIRLTVCKGDQQGKTYAMKGHTRCVMGRMEDCMVHFSHPQVSRYHCLLEWDGVRLMLRDFGSLNGTYINGKLFDKRPAGMSREQAMEMKHNETALSHGDVLSLANQAEVRVEFCEEIVQKECPRCKKKFTPAGNAGLCPDCAHREQVQAAMQNILKKRAEENRAAAQKKAEAPAPAKQPGDIIPGYKPVRSLGKGGMGEVMLVEERRTGRTMALKQIIGAMAQEQYARQEFLREMEIARQIDHKYAVKVHDVGEYNGRLYILMDYYAKGDMTAWLKASGWGANKYRTALELFLQIAEGLAYLHHAELKVSVKNGTQTVHGIVHRDIKPWNIFMDTSTGKPMVKIADYGLSKAYEAAGQTVGTLTGNGWKGTVAFMPRQQIMDTRYAKPDVDVWAATASIYFLLTGQAPKPRKLGQDAVNNALLSTAVPIRQYAPDVPKPLAEIIDRALQDRPGLYYKSGRELLADLKKIQGKI